MLLSNSVSLPILSLTTLLLSSTLTPAPSVLLVSALRTPSASNHHAVSRSHPRAHAHANVAFDQVKRQDQPSSRFDHVRSSVAKGEHERAVGPTSEEMYERAIEREVSKRGEDVGAALDGFKKRSGAKYVKKNKMMRKRDGGSCKIRSGASSSASSTAWTASSTDAWTVATTASSTDTWTAASSSSSWTPVSSSDSWSSAYTADSSSVSASATAGVGVGQEALTQNGGTSGLLNVYDATCGNSDATSEYPNGTPDWLTCGINNGGWTPPNISVAEVIGVSLASAADGVFSPCATYIDWFTEIGEATGIPGVALASIAMQESGCDATAVGPNGEIGLMQVTPANCAAMAGSNCYDYYGNIYAGATIFTSYIAAAQGNMLLAMGNYNGWVAASDGVTGTTVGATESVCPCGAQQNLDYLNSFFNGWLQGKSIATSYNNVANCNAANQC